MTCDNRGHYVDSDGYLGVALGGYFGEIGSRFKITLSTGKEIYVIKVDAKSSDDTDETMCMHVKDGSIIEFVINVSIAGDYYGVGGNGLVLNGNFNNTEEFSGDIIKIQREN